MSKIVVIGGSGFLGSHVADALSYKGHDVIIFDSTDSKWISNNQKFFKGDVTNLADIEEATKDADIVYNFAAIADLTEGINNPIETVKINILGTVNILKACETNNIKRFIFASTVYVNSREGGFYRCSKSACEDYIKEYSKLYGLDYTILRYGSLYGLRADTNNGLFKIISDTIKSGQLSYSGNSDAIRQYIHVSDASEASCDVMQDEFKNQTLVLTGQETMKVKELLLTISEILDLPSKEIEFKDSSQIGHYIRTPYTYSDKYAKKYIPRTHVDLGQGLLEVIDSIKNENNE